MTLFHSLITLLDRRLPGGRDGDEGFEIAQALALAAAAIFATLAVFAVFEPRATALVDQLFDAIGAG